MQLSDHLLRENVPINRAFSSRKDLLDRLAGRVAEKVELEKQAVGKTSLPAAESDRPASARV